MPTLGSSNYVIMREVERLFNPAGVREGKVGNKTRFVSYGGILRLILIVLILFGIFAIYSYCFDCLINQNILFFKTDWIC